MNDNQPDRFGKARVCITLTGEEWLAFLSRKEELSSEGAKLRNKASTKIQQQLIRASHSFRIGEER